MKVPISITINGSRYQRDVEPRLLLVHFIRDLGGVTRTKVGCDTSQCGSCTVLLDGTAVRSCTCLAVQADGSTVTTTQALTADGIANAANRGGADLGDDILGDIYASAEYRRAVAPVWVKRALTAAAARVA